MCLVLGIAVVKACNSSKNAEICLQGEYGTSRHSQVPISDPSCGELLTCWIFLLSRAHPQRLHGLHCLGAWQLQRQALPGHSVVAPLCGLGVPAGAYSREADAAGQRALYNGHDVKRTPHLAPELWADARGLHCDVCQ